MTFNHIIGQERAVNLLENALRENRLAHTLLFSGPEGTGKKLCAVTLAGELNCPEAEPGAGACGKCASCRQISGYTHPDVKVIVPEGKAEEIRIDKIRELRRELHLKPVKGKYKIFIINDSEKLNEESSNALLKVLEEPPENSVIILLSSDPSYLLPTIVSRCRIVKFRRLSAVETEKVLEKNPDIPADRRRLLAKLSEGSPGNALSLFQNGLEKRAEILKWISKSPAVDIDDILKEGEEKTGLNAGDPGQRRANLLIFFDILLSWYRDVLTGAAGGDVFLNEDFAGKVNEHAGVLKIDGAREALKVIMEARNRAGLYANPKLVFEVAMINLARLSGQT